MATITTTEPRKGTTLEILNRARSVLAERSKRCTYITLKRKTLEEFTEASFQKAKPQVQTLLEEYHKRLTPAKPKKRSQTLSPRTDGRNGNANKGGEGAEKETAKDARKKKSPKLYFYEMSEEDDKAAEGNRFIGNNDL